MKNVLYILNDCRRKFTYERTAGLCRAFERLGEPVDLYIVRSDGYSDFAPEHNCGEYNIFRLPDYSRFDGIFLDINSVFTRDSDTFASEGIRCAVEAAAASGKPVISMANEIAGLTFVGIDNYSAMQAVIRHLHGEMGLTDFWFVMGPADNYENLTRTRALLDYCRDNGLPCGEERFYAESFIVESGIRGFEELYSRHGGALPRAVICANDNIALGVCHAAQERGFEIPGDLMVTGFDNDDVSLFSPSITTVDQGCWSMGELCARAMQRIWQGETLPPRLYTPTKLFLRESTGHRAGQSNQRKQIREYIEHSSKTIDFRYRLSALQYQLPGCKSLEEMGGALVQCLSGLNCTGFRLVLDGNLMDGEHIICFDGMLDRFRAAVDGLPVQGYSDRMELVYSWERGAGAKLTRQKVGRSLNPGENAGSPQNYLYAPLHFMEHTVGYLAIRDCLHLIQIKGVSSIVNTLTMALRSYFSERSLSYINGLLSGISRRDELTGLYNRLGYHDLAYPLYRELCDRGGSLGILFMDMDELKRINDSYGHSAGDLAIKSVSNAILRSIPADAIPVRFGGDEFLVLAPDADQARIQAILDAMAAALPAEAKRLGAPDLLDFSAGVLLCQPDGKRTLDQYIQDADNLMYQEKKARKRRRGV